MKSPLGERAFGILPRCFVFYICKLPRQPRYFPCLMTWEKKGLQSNPLSHLNEVSPEDAAGIPAQRWGWYRVSSGQEGLGSGQTITRLTFTQTSNKSFSGTEVSGRRNHSSKSPVPPATPPHYRLSKASPPKACNSGCVHRSLRVCKLFVKTCDEVKSRKWQ